MRRHLGGFPRADFGAYLRSDYGEPVNFGQDDPGGYFPDPSPAPDPSDYTTSSDYSYDPSADYTTTVQALQLQDVPSGDTGGFDWNALANKLIAAGPSAILLAQRSGILTTQQAAALNNAVTGQGPRQPLNPTHSQGTGLGTVALLGIGALVAMKVLL